MRHQGGRGGEGKCPGSSRAQQATTWHQLPLWCHKGLNKPWANAEARVMVKGRGSLTETSLPNQGHLVNKNPILHLFYPHLRTRVHGFLTN